MYYCWINTNKDNYDATIIHESGTVWLRRLPFPKHDDGFKRITRYFEAFDLKNELLIGISQCADYLARKGYNITIVNSFYDFLQVIVLSDPENKLFGALLSTFDCINKLNNEEKSLFAQLILKIAVLSDDKPDATGIQQ